GDLVLAKDVRGNLEFAFKTKNIALDYFRCILKIGYFLQCNKDKIAMELMARVVDAAIKCGTLLEEELWLLSEREIIGRWDALLREAQGGEENRLQAQDARRGTEVSLKPNEAAAPCGLATDFLRLYKTYRTMKKVRGSAAPLEGYFCVQLAVKRRWINPLVGSRRICDVSPRAQKERDRFLAYNDTPYACVLLAGL
ncbi:MAG: hypothetical protein J6X95_05735, partial [Treponema sp.]|nr:hypothetical protein [Treponema sp.]